MKLMNNICCRTKERPTVYVLMRLYCPDLNKYEEYLDGQLKETLESVKKNKEDYHGRLVLVINDDTKNIDYGQYKKYQSELKSRLGGDCIIAGNSNNGGSALAMYRLRDWFVNNSKIKDNDIAIFLDHDDELRPRAVRRIARKMKPDGIVVAPFEMRDKDNLDITDDSGRLHNRIARLLSFQRYADDFINGISERPKKNKKEKLEFPFSRTELDELIEKISIKFCFPFEQLMFSMDKCLKGNRDSADLSSIGWTKSYTKSALKRYHEDLTALLKSRGGTDKYFRDHPAYEDFIDYYVFLIKDIKVSGVLCKTHTYIKSKNSITSTPHVEDFQDHRTAQLITLIDLCFAHEKDTQHKYSILRDNSKPLLLRFVASKVGQIEGILNKYRTEYIIEGKTMYAEFEEKTHPGFFVNKLCRLALGANRNSKQDKELFRFTTSRNDNSKENFVNLLNEETFKKVPQYKDEIIESTPKQLLIKAMDTEVAMRTNNKEKNEDDEIEKVISKNRTPHKKQLKRLRWYFWILMILGLILLGGLIFLKYINPSNPISGTILIMKQPDSIIEYQGLGSSDSNISFIKKLSEAVLGTTANITVFGAIVAAVLTFLLNEISKVKVLIENERATTKLYYSEFKDFTRHIEANIKVLVQIRKKIGNKNIHKIQNIHFDNLNWPESSCLFSDDMAKIISRDRVDDFARLKVNMRNANNSAIWLKKLAESGEDMRAAIDWEITRNIGYYIILLYMSKNDFCFPSIEQIDRFVNSNSTKHIITTLFMDYDYKEREENVKKYIDRYYDDRRMRRAILVECRK